MATALAVFMSMRRKSVEDLQGALRKAEGEPATKRSDVNAAAKRLMRAKEALKAAEEAEKSGETVPGNSGLTGAASGHNVGLPRR